METKTEHTSMPWHSNAIKGNRIVGDHTTSNAYDKIHINGANNTIAVVFRRKDAEIILRAVNSHDALIQAVKDLRYAFYVENSSKKLKEAFIKHGETLQRIIAEEGK